MKLHRFNWLTKWVQNFKETGLTINQPLSGRLRTSRHPENVEHVRASVREQPGFSTRKQSSILNVLRTSLNRILHKDLHLQPYKNQYGATCYTSNDSLCSVSKRGDINWPTRSPDLSPIDVCLWGYLKSRVFKSNPELNEHIREGMQNISRNSCQSVNENFCSRLHQC